MKALVRAAFIITALPLVILFRLLAMVCQRDAIWQSVMQFLSLLPGKIGCYQRVAFSRLTMNVCAPDVVIGFGTLFSHCDTDINSGVYIGPQCNIGTSYIGTNTLLGSGVHILSGKHQHSFSDPNVPIKDQIGVYEKIAIGENCWIGNGAIIMAAVGSNSIIAAGSVVVHDIPDNVIVGGNPAKIIRRLDVA
jgi:virginiamycin A acetyltransferase